MPSKPLNAFSPEYLSALRKKDEPLTAADADLMREALRRFLGISD